MNILTLGSFDVPHAGHAHFLRECERFGDVTVGLNTDEFIEHYKGNRPVFDYEARARVIRALGYTVVPNHTPGRELIIHAKPDVLAIGSDWARRDYYAQIDVTQDDLDAHDIRLLYIPYFREISTTAIKGAFNDYHQRHNGTQ